MASGRNLTQMKQILSALTPNNQLLASSLNKEQARQILPSSSSIFTRSGFYRRGFQTQTNFGSQFNENPGNQDSAPSNDLLNAPTQMGTNEDSAVKYSAFSKLKMSPRHDVAMFFTCKVCETRSMKTICRESYEKGVVVARCGGCDNLHLISDRLGWFGEPGSIEDFLAARGEEVKKGSLESLNLTLEDLAGSKALKA